MNNVILILCILPQDIALAEKKGIDGFVLNVGSDSWQRARVADAYEAAQQNGQGFKLFMSFDMSSMPCSNPEDGKKLREYITTYQSHPNQLKYKNAILASTFAGQDCRFGAKSLNEGWRNTLKTGLPPVHFVPSFFVDPATFGGLNVMDGSFSWNSGWPMGNYRINNNSDVTYVNNLGGRTYMAAVSPWFFTHYGKDTYNKNFIYRGDDWLFSERWEMLVKNRASIGIAQVISWNDFGESHYIGPIEGAQPRSEAWTTGFDHQGWLDLVQYYSSGFKTGSYPVITRDRVFMWSRLYPAGADAPDGIGKPTNWSFTEDCLWVVVLLTSPAQVRLTCGVAVSTTMVPSGLSKLGLHFFADCAAKVEIFRGGVLALQFAPAKFAFHKNPPNYNFNAFVAASP
ncbi:alpha-1,3-glucanase [Collybia nuda]|uniref:Alpha-1,3-glucanase n=1 Tax=Collybia nuda TaxID=64659 RepID=A0A9P5Y5D2_9AGAR|nr:alpha-1,3-glucanase [Collybia nuda]